MKKLYSLVLTLTIFGSAFSQSTYQTVYGILQSNCTTSGCHTTANPQGIDFSGTPQQVYANLVRVTPTNTTAAAAGMLLVDPGQPRNSFLFSKLHAGLEPNLSLTAGEGADMDSSRLSLTQREMVRQWILFGAQDSGTFVSYNLIDSFYTDKGGIPHDSLRVQAPPAPAPGEGYQLHFGPIFMYPGVEFEYNNKFPLHNDSIFDIYRMQTVENAETHHFAIYKFFPHADTLVPFAQSRVVGISDEALLYYNANVIAQWPKSKDVTFPQGLAEVFDTAAILDLDYHLINYEPYMIAAESYLNLYYDPHSTSTIPIQTFPVRYGGDNVFSLIIPPGDTTFSMVQGGGGQNLPRDADSTFYWNIVSLQAHTHKLGTDYNIWTRKSNGDKDSLIYDGRYNADYTHNIGSYAWNEAPYHQFAEPYPVYMANGMIHEATYSNPGTDTVTFGLLTSNEMFVTFVLYYESALPYTNIGDVPFSDNNIKMYPNPANDIEYIRLDDNMVLNGTEMQMFDELGQKVLEQKGITTHVFSANMRGLANGCYVYRIINNGANAGTGKIVVQR